MKRTALYARVSTDKQAREGVSLDSQQRMALDRCAASGWSLTETYTDVMSGRKDARPHLARLMKDAEAGKVDVVLVYRLDRLGRSLVHTLQTCGELADLGVKVVSLTQPFEIDGPLGKLLLAIYASFAEMESEAIGARIRDARRHRVLTAGNHYAVAPYGYKRTKGEALMTVDPEKAAVVREAFDRFNAGDSIRTIVTDLNGRGILSPTGKLWTLPAMRVVLSNPAYVGLVTHGRKLNRRTSKGEVRRTKQAHGDYLQAPGAHEALIDEATWQAAQKRLTETQGVPGRRSAAIHHRPWLRVARCGLCGSRLSAHSTRGYVTYVCSRIDQSGKGACTLSSISGRLLSATLVPEMARVLDHPHQAAKGRKRKPTTPRTDPAAELARLEAAIARESDLYRAGAQSFEAMAERVKELNARKEALTQAAPESPQGPQSTPPPFPNLVATWKGSTDPLRAEVVRSLVERVTVTNDALTLTWKREFHHHLGAEFTVPRLRLRGSAVTAVALD